MTITVYEFETIDDDSGDPIHPPTTTTRDVALDTTHTFQPHTKIAQVVTTTNIRLMTGGTPTSTDYYLAANGTATIRLPRRDVAGITVRATAG